MILLVLLAPAAASAAWANGPPTPDPQECRLLRRFAKLETDASPAIASCLSKLPDRGTLRLAPGRYHLRSPFSINRPVTIESAPAASEGACRVGNSGHCAVLVIDPMSLQSAQGIMPIEITASDVELRMLAIIASSGRSPLWEKRICLDERTRPLGGGVRVHGNNFRMDTVLVRNVSCYSALEIVAGVVRPSILNSVIGPNGTHNLPQMWSDGITLHDATGAHVEGNIFRDNTDVQLIFGGCRDCAIRSNKFRHSMLLKHASFAELMLHAWPNTSGDFTGSMTSRNDIDCGAARQCGYGIMIGGEPWYPARTFGGSVSANYVRHALIALNIDKLTGYMNIAGNLVSGSGGASNSDCGNRIWPAINISPRSTKFARIDTDKIGSLDTTKCLFLHKTMH